MQDLDHEWKEAIGSADVLLLQREVPEEVNILAAKYARANGVKVLLDMGGKDEDLSDELIRQVDILSPNETELSRLKVFVENQSMPVKLENLIKCNPGMDILLKQGADGAAYYENSFRDFMEASFAEFDFAFGSKAPGYTDTYQKAFSFKDYDGVSLVDTTGAGDSFTGAYAVALVE